MQPQSLREETHARALYLSSMYSVQRTKGISSRISFPPAFPYRRTPSIRRPFVDRKRKNLKEKKKRKRCKILISEGEAGAPTRLINSARGTPGRIER